MDRDRALGIVRLLISSGIDKEEALNNPVIPVEYREHIRAVLISEEVIVLRPPTVLTGEPNKSNWLTNYDRSDWFFWNNLRQYLLSINNFSEEAVRNLDDSSDRILQQLGDPSYSTFDIKGLVLGYVQSGKTANYTALIAKAVDVGYRLIIVLSGIDNALRRQTQIRLDRELVGFSDNGGNCVPYPEVGKQWHQFTNEDFNGDFDRGRANVAALQGTQPVLLVMKKNGSVIRRLLRWLEDAPPNNLNSLPVLIIDDEADLASIDTRGTYLQEDELDDVPDDYEQPSVINGLIRQLLAKFSKKAYVAYTATPFANILIPHDSVDVQGLQDLYPKDFIIDLPKPAGYFGAEELFGRFDSDIETEFGGKDAIRFIPEKDVSEIDPSFEVPRSLENAILLFVLACAVRAKRNDEMKPATMLIHVSHIVATQMIVYKKVEETYGGLRNQWRYFRGLGIEERLRKLWVQEYQNCVLDGGETAKTTSFDQIRPELNKVFESIKIKVINYKTGDFLNYEEDPTLKVIAIGGNRLSRGLTLEGLVISYFYRPTRMYDTLLQMGRWFGYRKGYDDLVRIFLTQDLASKFSDLARVEYEIREDIKLYEAQGVTPIEVGLRILSHPSMLVTSKLKQRFSSTITIRQSYSGQVLQTFRFPFSRSDKLTQLLRNNLEKTDKFIRSLGQPNYIKNMPKWIGVPPDKVVGFLEDYQVDSNVRNIYLPLVIDYINFQNERSELDQWTIIVRGRESLDETLGDIDYGFGTKVPMASRSRKINDPDSLGVITSPGDETLDLDEDEISRLDQFRTDNPKIGINPAARVVRNSRKGLLLIYPISKYSGHDLTVEANRQPLFHDPNGPLADNVICFAISFPYTLNEYGPNRTYVLGTVPWSEYERN
jgi:hypothetical protein